MKHIYIIFTLLVGLTSSARAGPENQSRTDGRRPAIRFDDLREVVIDEEEEEMILFVDKSAPQGAEKLISNPQPWRAISWQ